MEPLPLAEGEPTDKKDAGRKQKLYRYSRALRYLWGGEAGRNWSWKTAGGRGGGGTKRMSLGCVCTLDKCKG